MVITNEEETRGIDAPESSMPYGKEAKEELTKVVEGKSLRVLIFDQDRYGRSVGDIYCNGIFVQVLKSIQYFLLPVVEERLPVLSWLLM